jgi:hypothetical protein
MTKRAGASRPFCSVWRQIVEREGVLASGDLKRKIQKTAAIIAAVLAAGYGTATLWSVGQSAWSLAGFSGSAGIGAVSFGLIETLVPLWGAVANRVLVRWARRSGGVVLALHRAHSMMWLLLAVLFAASVVLLAAFQVSFGMRFLLVIGVIGGFTVAAQSLLLAVLLALFGLGRSA